MLLIIACRLHQRSIYRGHAVARDGRGCEKQVLMVTMLKAVNSN